MLRPTLACNRSSLLFGRNKKDSGEECRILPLIKSDICESQLQCFIYERESRLHIAGMLERAEHATSRLAACIRPYKNKLSCELLRKRVGGVTISGDESLCRVRMIPIDADLMISAVLTNRFFPLPTKAPMPSWSQTEGNSQPLGSIWLENEQSFNFALYSRHATTVTLLL
jgi:hypothetical protein